MSVLGTGATEIQRLEAFLGSLARLTYGTWPRHVSPDQKADLPTFVISLTDTYPNPITGLAYHAASPHHFPVAGQEY